MGSLSEILFNAQKEHWATGHFNISNLEQLRAIMEAARKFNAPIMIGLSEGERKICRIKTSGCVGKIFSRRIRLACFFSIPTIRTL